MQREVLPHVPDAWVDGEKTKVGYEVSFNRYFYKYSPPRDLQAIQEDIRSVEADIAKLLRGDFQ